MFPPGTRGRARGLPYTMDAFMLGMGMLGESGWDPGDPAESPWTGASGDLYTQLGYLPAGQTALPVRASVSSSVDDLPPLVRQL